MVRNAPNKSYTVLRWTVPCRVDGAMSRRSPSFRDRPKVGLKDPHKLRSWGNQLRLLSDNAEEPFTLSHSAASGGGMGESGRQGEKPCYSL
jgi:hypothetical protein